VARLATDPWLLWAAQDLGSEAHRHFPVQGGSIFRSNTDLFRSKAVGSARATHIRLEIPAQGGTRPLIFHKRLESFIFPPPTRDNTGYRAWCN
jgi:hypothetical protein